MKRKSPEVCTACKILTNCDSAHIRTKAASGINDDYNLMPLCRRCHRMQHDKGWSYMSETYPGVKNCLKYKGWEVIEEFGRKKLVRG